MKTVKKHRMSYERTKALAGFLFILPWVIGFVFIIAKSLITSLMYSFCDTEITSSGIAMTFTGIDYYKKAFITDPDFVRDLTEQLKTLIVNTPIILAFSLFIAVILNQNFIGRTAARVIFFVPVVVGSGGIILSLMSSDPVSSSLMTGSRSSLLFEATSLETMLQNTGIPDSVITLISSTVSEIFNLTWHSGLQIVLCLAGLQGISPALYEAAEVEGASAWEEFWMITFPMIMPILLVNVIYTIIETFTDYNNAVMKSIIQLTRVLDFSYAAAMSWVYFVIISETITAFYWVLTAV
jgi:ABC-type sugar transport system permease subunit